MSCKVAFIGLGVMGYPMAGYISKGGHNVTVFNRTKSKAEKWIKEYKGKMVETPAEAVKGAEYIFTCVGNDNDLREVTFGDSGAFKTIKKGAIYIDNTTASATIAREIYEYAKKNGFGALDAPVSGGQAGAENGALTMLREVRDERHAESARNAATVSARGPKADPCRAIHQRYNRPGDGVYPRQPGHPAGKIRP